MTQTNNTVNIISHLAAWLVGLLALLAFVLSYSSLQHLAAQHGIGQYLSYLWPLLLDFAMIVFSLAILRANLRQEKVWYPWALTIVFATLATVGNVLDVTTLGIPPAVIGAGVKALAPVALVLAFELLMTMIRAEVKRSAVVQSLVDLVRQRTEAEEERATLAADIERLTGKAEALQAELKTLRSEKRTLTYSGIGEDTRAQALEILRNDAEISGAELGRQLGRSGSTGRKLKNELLPLATANGNGKGAR